MKNITLKIYVILLAILFTGFSLSAQEKKEEKSKMAVKVMKKGKTVLDTTYFMDEDFDKDKIEAMIEGLDGDSKTINIFKTGKGEKFLYDYSTDNDIDSLSERQLKWISKDGNEMFFSESDEFVLDEIKGHGQTKIVTMKRSRGDAKSDSKVIIVKEGGDGECDAVFHFKSDGENVWTSEKDNVVIGHLKDDGNVWKAKRKSQISLDLREDGLYRMAFESEELEPIQIEVFNGEGDRLFKKKVKNFYGRFLKDIELSGNETGLFTVRVLQGENEIIGEFEYK